jgi:hypothetical protein
MEHFLKKQFSTFFVTLFIHNMVADKTKKHRTYPSPKTIHRRRIHDKKEMENIVY